MEEQTTRKPPTTTRKLVNAGTALEIFIGIAVVVPLTLWLAWAHRSNTLESIILTLFCGALVWSVISIARWKTSLRNLGWRSPGRMALGMGPRPDDPDKLDIWKKGAQFRYSFTATLLCIAAYALVKWMHGK